MTTCRLLTGDALAVLRTLPDASVQCAITSPPYFGLRNYDVDGQIGLEATPDAFIAALVAVFRDVRRVLRADGTLWVNIGDSYVGNPSTSSIPRALQGNGDGKLHIYGDDQMYARRKHANGATPLIKAGLKMKDLIGIPWMLAFALRADGWYLRSDVIWAKPAPMPESVTDRPTRSHEYLFLLSKSQAYYYDAAAIAEPVVKGAAGSEFHTGKTGANGMGRVSIAGREISETRNKRSVWVVNTAQFAGSHYAVMPAKLVEPCILAGSSPQACEHCGAPWARTTERVAGDTEAHMRPKHLQSAKSTLSLSGNGSAEWAKRGAKTVERGWRPTCSCPDNTGSGACTVLDPFSGTATVGSVALAHGRSYIGIDIDARNLPLARQRIGPLLCDIGSERADVAI